VAVTVRRSIGISMLAGLAVLGCGKSTEAPALSAEQQGEQPAKPPVNEEEQAYIDNANAETLKTIEPLAYQGDATSQRMLGVMYYLGQGVPQDLAQASDWLTKSAEQGDNVAQMMLGAMYSAGQGVPQDLVRAHSWLSLAAAQGNPSAKKRIDELTPKMSPEQIASANKSAVEWKARHPG
jgi:TPR repeat protein